MIFSELDADNYKAAILSSGEAGEMIIIRENKKLEDWDVAAITPQGIELRFNADATQIGFVVGE